MKLRILWISLFLVGIALGAEVATTSAGPEPAPWWMRVEEAQSLALRWIGFIGIVLTALITMLGALWMKVKELKERMERATEDKRALQLQVTDLAKMVPPPVAPPLDQDRPRDPNSGV